MRTPRAIACLLLLLATTAQATFPVTDTFLRGSLGSNWTTGLPFGGGASCQIEASGLAGDSATADGGLCYWNADTPTAGQSFAFVQFASFVAGRWIGPAQLDTAGQLIAACQSDGSSIRLVSGSGNGAPGLVATFAGTVAVGSSLAIEREGASTYCCLTTANYVVGPWAYLGACLGTPYTVASVANPGRLGMWTGSPGTTTTTTTTTTTSTTLAGTAMVDWSGSMVAWWQFEGTLGSTNASCGAGCGMTNNGGLTFSSVLFIQGKKSVNPDGTLTKYGSCLYSGTPNCSVLNGTGAATFTVGGAAYGGTVGHYNSLMDAESDATQGGFFVNIQPSSSGQSNIGCGWCGTSGGVACNESDQQFPAGQGGNTTSWGWWGCKYTSANHVVSYLNGKNVHDAAMVTPGNLTASNGTQFVMPSDFTSGCFGGNGLFNNSCAFSGNMDDTFYYAGNMADSSMCRICACNVQGDACGTAACNGTSYTACTTDAQCGGQAGACDTVAGLCQGRRDTNCGGCTMPASCNQATP